MSMLIEVWGPYACFTAPPLKVERATYDVMTPSAARGLVEAIYWHPGMKYHIDRIYVLNRIRFNTIRRNEVSSKLTYREVLNAIKGGPPPALYPQKSNERQQRSALLLKDVHYVIECHFTMTYKAAPSDNPGKFQDTLRRRLKRGQCYHTPYFGCREFPANFREWPGGPIPTQSLNQDLGFMLYDLDYSDPENLRPQFFRAKLENGVLDCRDAEVFT